MLNICCMLHEVFAQSCNMQHQKIGTFPNKFSRLVCLGALFFAPISGDAADAHGGLVGHGECGEDAFWNVVF